MFVAMVKKQVYTLAEPKMLWIISIIKHTDLGTSLKPHKTCCEFCH